MYLAFSKRLPVSLYIKMVVGEITKTTSVNDVRCSSNVGVVFDDLKHFLVTVSVLSDYVSLQNLLVRL